MSQIPKVTIEEYFHHEVCDGNFCAVYLKY